MCDAIRGTLYTERKVMKTADNALVKIFKGREKEKLIVTGEQMIQRDNTHVKGWSQKRCKPNLKGGSQRRARPKPKGWQKIR